MAKLYVLSRNGGDGSSYPVFTVDSEVIKHLENLDDEGELDYDSGWTDGDGFHYETLTIPDDLDPTTLGVSLCTIQDLQED